jgi:hypothetical protein
MYFKQWLAHTVDWIIGPLTRDTFSEILSNLSTMIIILVLIVIWVLGIFISPIANIFRLGVDVRNGKKRIAEAKKAAEESSSLHDILWYVNRSKETIILLEDAHLVLSCYYEKQALGILQEREVWLRLQHKGNDMG